MRSLSAVTNAGHGAEQEKDMYLETGTVKTPIGNLKIKMIDGFLTELNTTDEDVRNMNIEKSPNLEYVYDWIERYFKGENHGKTPEMKPHGTEFQKHVWKVLTEIPYGKSLSYSDIAKKINKNGAARAVGQAVGKNPIIIIIPCHRVLAKHGLGGFSAGIDVKKKLLDIENIVF